MEKIVLGLAAVFVIALVCYFIVVKGRPTSETTSKVAEPVVPLPMGFQEIVYGPDSECAPYQKDGKTSSAVGDFDGDGTQDTAKIITQAGGKEEFLYAWLSSRKFVPTILEEIKDGEGFNNMSISVAPRGAEIEDACGNGFEELCEPDDPQKLKLKNDSLSFTQCGSATSLFIWNSKESSFKHLWLDD